MHGGGVGALMLLCHAEGTALTVALSDLSSSEVLASTVHDSKVWQHLVESDVTSDPPTPFPTHHPFPQHLRDFHDTSSNFSSLPG